MGRRLRIATAAWLDRLGPLAEALFLFSASEAQDLDEVTVAVNIDCSKLAVSWMVSDAATNDVPPSVISGELPMDRSRVSRSHPIPTDLNWVREISRKPTSLTTWRSASSGLLYESVISSPALSRARCATRPESEIHGSHFPDNAKLFPRQLRPLYPEGNIVPTCDALVVLHTRADA